MNQVSRLELVVEDSPLPEVEEQTTSIYRVTADDWDTPGRTVELGYARGCEAVVRAYYDDGSHKNVRAVEIQIPEVTLGMLEGKQLLTAQKHMMQRRLGEIERELRTYNS